MQYEPRPAIHMEKQLGWTHKLGWVESLGMSKVGQTVLARLMEFQLWHSLFLWLCAGRVQKMENGLYPPFCLGEVCPPALALMLDTSLSPCMPLFSLKLELRGSESD